MPILQEIPIALSVEKVVEAQKPRRRRNARSSPATTKAAKRAIDLAQVLYTPAAVYAELQIKKLEVDHIIVASQDGQKEFPLRIGPHTNLLAPATRLLAAVYTIGPALGEHVEQLNRDGEALAAYWLDTVGVMALGEVGETLRCIAEEKAMERDWGVSPALSPGSLVGWPLRGQRELCALLPLDEIGVTLGKNCVLVPFKSVSLVIGLGPDYESHQIGSVCRFCALADSCWRRR